MAGLPLRSAIEPIEVLFAKGRFEPAPVQRDYQWRPTHCRVLLADLDRTFTASSLGHRAAPVADAEEADTDRIDGELATISSDAPTGTLDHYMLGAIVVTPPIDTVRHVYDGLQRLTTLTVLIAVLRDLTADDALRARLDRLIRADTRTVRLKLAGKDRTLASQIQPMGESIRQRRADIKTDMGRRIRAAAEVFREGLKPWPIERRDAFARFVMEKVVVDLQEAQDVRLARQMFITGNLRGKRLDRVDLLKGQLTDIAPDEAAAERIVLHWNGARNLAGDRFEALLVTIDLIERQKPQSEDCLNELADHVAAVRGPAGIEAWLNRLTHFAGDDAELHRTLTTLPTDPLSADIWRLQMFRWTDWRPLALLWLADLRRSSRNGAVPPAKTEAAARRFHLLHRRCMGIALAGFSPADRETIFIRAVKQVIAGGNPFGSGGALSFRPLQIGKIAETLRTPITDRDVRSTLIRWYESLQHGGQIPAYVRDATVEHILPQKIATVPEWVAAFPDQAERFLACNALGNLAALDRTRNEKVKNKRMIDKAAVYADAARDFVTLRDIDTTAPWTTDSIRTRTARLAADIEASLELVVFSGAARRQA